MTQKWQVVETKRRRGEDGMRLDRWFKTHYADLPHSRLEKLLRTGQVRVDGGRVKASTRLEAGSDRACAAAARRAPPTGAEASAVEGGPRLPRLDHPL